MRLALFDLDGTLLPIDSDHAFGEFMVRLGWADGDEFKRANDLFYAQYQAERLDVEAYIHFATAAWRERSAAEQLAASERFTREVIAPTVHAVARALVKLGGRPVLREDVVTDNGNVILDVHGLSLANPVEMEARIRSIAGVVTVGLFAQRGADVILVGADEGVTEIKPRRS